MNKNNILNETNTGNDNTGIGNTGDCNTGNWNVGGSNTGYQNIGDYNVGDGNLGFWNTGNNNTGHNNVGNCNIGNNNAGHWNISYGNSGCFNTVEHKIMLFDKISDLTLSEWEFSKACELLSFMPNQAQWIWGRHMTEKEKEDNPSYEIVGGYLRKLTQEELFEQRQLWFDNLSEANKKIILSIPNFDAKIFKRCTGIDVEMEDR